MNLILIHPGELNGGRAVLTGERAAHVRGVLKAGTGRVLRIGLLNGPPGEGTVERLEPLTLACKWKSEVPPQPAVDLLLALPRPKVMKRLWAQLAALGVGRILLTNAAKVERFYFDTHVLEPGFYNTRLIEGLQQACDTRLPEVRIIKQLKPFLEDELDSLCPDGLRLLADPSGERSLLDAGWSGAGHVLLAVGPEGGWTPYEIGLFRENGFETIGMGPRILRTDTACIALLGMIAEMKRRGQ